MQVIYHEKYIELIPAENYISDLAETEAYKGLCGKNINPDNYKDISDEKAEEIFRKQEEMNNIEEEESIEIEEGVENNE